MPDNGTLATLPRLRVRLKARAYDWLRHAPVVSEAQALSLAARYRLGRQSDSGRLMLLSTALRRTRSGPVRARLERWLKPYVVGPQASVWRAERVGWNRIADELREPALVKCLVLKAPAANGEKGVLYLSFEVNWLRVIGQSDLGRLMEEYLLVGASSSSPADYASLLAFAGAARDPVFVQVSNMRDPEDYRVCAPVIRPIPLMACDWINPAYYQPRPHAAREVDLLMVAGWGRVKRHWLLFHALRKMRKGLRVLLIGQDMDRRTPDDIWAEAKAYSVASRIELVRDAPMRLVTEYQCNSKVNVVLSRREGSNVVTTESFFADSPVAMLRGAHVGAIVYINDKTGRLVSEDTLHRDLEGLIDESASFAPRGWAMEHVTCFHSTTKLNRILRAYSAERGMPWTTDIAPMCWRPDPIYIDPASERAMAGAYRSLVERHGVRFRDHPAV